jgi:hypothetical protein
MPKLKTKLKQQEFYCVCCSKRVKVAADKICVKIYKNNYYTGGNTPALRSYCEKCDCNLTKFIKHKDEAKLTKKFGKW